MSLAAGFTLFYYTLLADQIRDDITTVFNVTCIFITGEVIFNQTQPDFPHDFIFGSQDQDFVPNVEELEVKVHVCFFEKID